MNTHYLTLSLITEYTLFQFGSRNALNVAKYNVEHNYIMVGILEDLKSTLQTMEKILPRFFKGNVIFF